MVRGIEQAVIVREDADRAAFLARRAAPAEGGAVMVSAWALLPTPGYVYLRTGGRALARSMRTLLTVITRACRHTATTPEEVAGGGRRPAVTHARAGIAHLWIGALSPSGRRLALVLGRRRAGLRGPWSGHSSSEGDVSGSVPYFTEMTVKPTTRSYLFVCCFALASGCAHDVARTGTTLTPGPSSEQSRLIEIERDAEITLDTGYQRRLPSGSRWVLIGTLPQGKAYKIVDGAFTVEGAHVHEAYLVLDGNELAGFYLPVEKAFAPLSARSRLQFKPMGP